MMGRPGVVGTTEQANIVHLVTTAFAKGTHVVEFHEAALGAPAAGSVDVGTLVPVALGHLPPDLSRNVPGALCALVRHLRVGLVAGERRAMVIWLRLCRGLFV